ncbi:hypothetical protein K458DRAFT_396436 [Lentithecium fluviatile CBS 122367]|uniref:Uncharacterized protein n=1 Tax=Lentithecium fluviatile CBS 122367 TaxID=1168545 RepID=A0A6G1IFJ8_9PLEO|nr:hypothetical protein K458DRAFT_396436 [Lentithecium fluviatile CBS 122367]
MFATFAGTNAAKANETAPTLNVIPHKPQLRYTLQPYRHSSLLLPAPSRQTTTHTPSGTRLHRETDEERRGQRTHPMPKPPPAHGPPKPPATATPQTHSMSYHITHSTPPRPRTFLTAGTTRSTTTSNVSTDNSATATQPTTFRMPFHSNPFTAKYDLGSTNPNPPPLHTHPSHPHRPGSKPLSRTNHHRTLPSNTTSHPTDTPCSTITPPIRYPPSNQPTRNTSSHSVPEKGSNGDPTTWASSQLGNNPPTKPTPHSRPSPRDNSSANDNSQNTHSNPPSHPPHYEHRDNAHTLRAPPSTDIRPHQTRHPRREPPAPSLLPAHSAATPPAAPLPPTTTTAAQHTHPDHTPGPCHPPLPYTHEAPPGAAPLQGHTSRNPPPDTQTAAVHSPTSNSTSRDHPVQLHNTPTTTSPLALPHSVSLTLRQNTITHSVLTRQAAYHRFDELLLEAIRYQRGVPRTPQPPPSSEPTRRHRTLLHSIEQQLRKHATRNNTPHGDEPTTSALRAHRAQTAPLAPRQHRLHYCRSADPFPL